MSSTTDRLGGYRSGLGWKAPCRVSSTANLTLSGLQTVDGVVLEAGNRVLVRNQADPAENGVWVAGEAAWQRARDFASDNDVVCGTRVYAYSGSAAGDYEVTTADPIVIGTSTLTFAMIEIGSVGTIPAVLEEIASTGWEELRANWEAMVGGLGGSLLDGDNQWLNAVTTYVAARIALTVGSPPSNLNTLQEIATALGNDPAFAATVSAALALKAPIASPALTGTPTAPTAASGNSTTQLATTAFVTTADNLKAPIASPTFTGTPAAPTPDVDDDSTRIATTAFVQKRFSAPRTTTRRLFTSAQTWWVRADEDSVVHLSTAGVTVLMCTYVPEHFRLVTEVDPTIGAGFIIDTGVTGINTTNIIYGSNPRAGIVAGQSNYRAMQQRPGTRCVWIFRSSGRPLLESSTPSSPILRQTGGAPITEHHFRYDNGYYEYYADVAAAAASDTTITIPHPDNVVSWDITDAYVVLAQRMDNTGNRYEPYHRTLTLAAGVTTVTIQNPTAGIVPVNIRVPNLFPVV